MERPAKGKNVPKFQECGKVQKMKFADNDLGQGFGLSRQMTKITPFPNCRHRFSRV